MRIIVSLCLISSLAASAASREWKNADASRSVNGEFVARDDTEVSIRRSGDHKLVSIPLDQLHPDDRSWLNANHPLPAAVPPPATPPPPNAVFDQLSFGDKRPQVLEKLKASKVVEATVDETFFGRTGFNGVFRTSAKIGGLHSMLYFDWDDTGGLREITLHTDPLPKTSLETRLIPCWQEFIQLLTTLHGEPVNANPVLALTPIQDGGILCTHLWKLENSHSAMLGASRDGDSYQIAVRFTTEDIQPVIIPAGTVPGAPTSPSAGE